MKEMSFTDIRTNGFLSVLPDSVKPYAKLMRLDRPIGVWLLLIPCWWGVALSATFLPNLWLMIVFAVGAIVMRGAGCIINDIYDRDLDRHVERTQLRPLASGEVKLWQAALFLGVLLLIGFGILLSFNRPTIVLGALSLLLVFSYPLMKRITWWPQLFLGITFNWGILMGGSAITGKVDIAHIITYLAGVFWTLGYDTIYAHQDKLDDEQLGIKSTALLFGERSLRWISLFYALTILLLLLAGWVAQMDKAYDWVLLIAACYASVQLIVWQPDDQENCLARFKSNRDFGLIILSAFILGRII